MPKYTSQENPELKVSKGKRLENLHISYNKICDLLLQMMHNANPECICEKVLPAGTS